MAAKELLSSSSRSLGDPMSKASITSIRRSIVRSTVWHYRIDAISHSITSCQCIPHAHSMCGPASRSYRKACFNAPIASKTRTHRSHRTKNVPSDREQFGISLRMAVFWRCNWLRPRRDAISQYLIAMPTMMACFCTINVHRSWYRTL